MEQTAAGCSTFQNFLTKHHSFLSRFFCLYNRKTANELFQICFSSPLIIPFLKICVTFNISPTSSWILSASPPGCCEIMHRTSVHVHLCGCRFCSTVDRMSIYHGDAPPALAKRTDNHNGMGPFVTLRMSRPFLLEIGSQKPE